MKVNSDQYAQDLILNYLDFLRYSFSLFKKKKILQFSLESKLRD